MNQTQDFQYFMKFMKQNKLSIGDIFEVQLEANMKQYLQIIARDTSQLNSEVIRSFKKKYPKEDNPPINEIVKGVVDFYAHCYIKWGLKQALWKKIGHSDEVGPLNIYFKDSNDYGDPNILVSDDWWIWRINEDHMRIGKLTEKYKNAEIGVVVPANSIIHRMKTGFYDFKYPSSI